MARTARAPRAPRLPTVHKFGGASLADGAAVRHAAAILSAQPGPRVAVVSAMAGVTDALLAVADRSQAGDEVAVAATIEALRARHTEAARLLLPEGEARAACLAEIHAAFDELSTLARGLAILRELTPRTADTLVARGERLSARLFAAALEQAGVPAKGVDAVELIATDGRHGNAFPDLAATDESVARVLPPLLARGLVPVVPGFLGATPEGRTATLGRGGADLTATLLGRGLGAARVVLWKDVPGLLTADPRVVPDARVLPRLDAREAAELAYYGAKVLHPSALIPLAGRGVPLVVRPFQDPAAPGTEIAAGAALPEHPVQALSAVRAQALVTVAGSGMLGVPGVAARTFAALQREGISVSLISQASSEHSICFGLPEADADRAHAALAAEFRAEMARREIDGVEVRRGAATIAVVGLGMPGTPGMAARVFTALAEAGVNVVAIAQGSSELNLSLVVDGRDADAAVRAIHAAFQLDKVGGGSAPRPERVDVVLLGFGAIGRELAALVAKARPGQVRVVAAIDRGGYVFSASGLPPRSLARLAAAKRAGTGLAALPGGRAASPEEALAEIARHALSRPVLVDATAGETAPLLSHALAAGMSLALANKRPLSGPRDAASGLQALARAHGRRVLYEATVGAGLPILDTYAKLLESGDRVERIEGCLSGTLGFLLTAIGRGERFSAALKEAMARGYTEPDPRDDLSGVDVGRKALILARLLGYRGELADLALESLVPAAARDLPLADFLDRLEEHDEPWRRRAEAARERGATLRYVATVTRRRATVGLVEAGPGSPFAALHGTDNQVAFTTARYATNPLVITGPGAGLAVTAAGVLNDVLKLAGA